MSVQNKVELSVRLRKIPKGADGQSAFKSIVFKRSATQPAAPTGGSYTTPVPGDSWSDGIPDESGGMPCWMSSRTFTSDGLFPQDAAWTTPKKVADTSDFDVCFSASETQPAISTLPPQGSNQEINGWHNTAGVNDIWMATATCSNGQWSAWSVVKIKGENGDDGKDSVSVSIIPNSVVYPEGGTIDASGNAVATSFTLSAVINKGGTLITSGVIQSRLLAATGNSNGNITSSNNKGAHFAGGVLTFATNATYEGVVIATIIYDGESYTAPLTITRASKGAGGEQGPAGNDGVSPVVVKALPETITYTDGKEKDVHLVIAGSVGGVTTTSEQSSSITIDDVWFDGNHMSAYQNVTVDMGNYNIRFGSSAYFQGVIKLLVSFEGEEYYAYIQVNKTYRGSPGPAGLVWRKREWVIGEYYRNDSDELANGDETEDGFYYLDFVMLKGNPDTAWTCKESHTATANKRPSDVGGSEGAACWQKMSRADSFYTPLLLANNASIDFMQGNSLKIYGTDNSNNPMLKAGVVGASGSYPIFFSSPRKTPIKVDVLFGVASSSTGTPSTWLVNQLPSVSTTQSLRAKLRVTYSDGSTADTSNTVTVVSNPPTSPATFKLQYAKSSSSGLPSSGWSTSFVQPTQDEIYGFAKIYVYNSSNNLLNSGAGFQYGTWYASADTLSSTFQVKDSGETMIGEPYGPRIIMSPRFQYENGRLPRMEVYDINGNVAALFDGSTVSSSNELYGSDAIADVNIDIGILSAQLAGNTNEFMATSKAEEITFTCPSTCTINIPKFKLNVKSVVTANAANDIRGTARWTMLIDGNYITSHQHAIDAFSTASEDYQAQISASHSAVLSAGTHKITLSVSLYLRAVNDDGPVYREGEVSLWLEPSIVVCSFSIDRQICRYFANGFAIGSSTSNYCMAWNNGGTMNFICENPTAGIRVTASGVEVMKADGQWASIVPS